MGTYSSTRFENDAWNYCVKHKSWKVGINLKPYKKGEKPSLSPEAYGPGEIQKQIYKASVYYYNKYGLNTKTN